VVTYCYRRPDGHVVERIFPAIPGPRLRQRIRCGDGVTAERDFAAECTRLPGRPRVSLYPRFSDALGVHPDQIDEFRKEDSETDFTPDGRAIIKSRAHWKRALKRAGMQEK